MQPYCKPSYMAWYRDQTLTGGVQLHGSWVSAHKTAGCFGGCNGVIVWRHICCARYWQPATSAHNTNKVAKGSRDRPPLDPHTDSNINDNKMTTATTLVLLVGPREARPSQGSNTFPFLCTRNCTRLKTLRHQKQRLLGPLLDSSASKRVAPTGQPTKSLYNSCDTLQQHPRQHLCV